MALISGHKEVPSHRRKWFLTKRSASLIEIVENESRSHYVNKHPVISLRIIS